MLRKQTKKILVVMLFALTLVLAGRVDAMHRLLHRQA